MIGFSAIAAAAPDGVGHHRRDLLVHVVQLVADGVVVAAVVEAARLVALVEVAEPDVAERPVLDHEHRHRRGVDAGHRADAAVGVARRDADLARRELRLGVLGAIAASPSNCAAPRIASRWPPTYSLPRQRRARREDQVRREAGHDLAGGPDVGQERLRAAQPLEREPVGIRPPSGPREVLLVLPLRDRRVERRIDAVRLRPRPRTRRPPRRGR